MHTHAWPLEYTKRLGKLCVIACIVWEVRISNFNFLYSHVWCKVWSRVWYVLERLAECHLTHTAKSLAKSKEHCTTLYQHYPANNAQSHIYTGLLISACVPSKTLAACVCIQDAWESAYVHLKMAMIIFDSHVGIMLIHGLEFISVLLCQVRP